KATTFPAAITTTGAAGAGTSTPGEESVRAAESVRAEESDTVAGATCSKAHAGKAGMWRQPNCMGGT
ncbi:MAG: hypothetical protein WD205_10310, partial [Rhodothermales bacterium]